MALKITKSNFDTFLKNSEKTYDQKFIENIDDILKYQDIWCKNDFDRCLYEMSKRYTQVTGAILRIKEENIPIYRGLLIDPKEYHAFEQNLLKNTELPFDPNALQKGWYRQRGLSWAWKKEHANFGGKKNIKRNVNDVVLIGYNPSSINEFDTIRNHMLFNQSEVKMNDDGTVVLTHICRYDAQGHEMCNEVCENMEKSVHKCSDVNQKVGRNIYIIDYEM